MDKYIKQYQRKSRLSKAKSKKSLYVSLTIVIDILLVGLFYALFWGSSKLLAYVVVFAFPTLLLTSAIATFTYKFLNGYFDK